MGGEKVLIWCAHISMCSCFVSCQRGELALHCLKVCRLSIQGKGNLPMCLTAYLFRKADNQTILRLAHQRLEEILAAGGQHGPVPSELLPLHQDSHIAQDILLPLVVEAEEDIGTMNCRLIHIHGGFRLLIHGHSAHTLEIETQQRGVVSLQPSPASAYRSADISPSRLLPPAA